MNRFERELLPVVFKALKGQISSFIKGGLNRNEVTFTDEGVRKAVLKIYKTVGSYFADRTYYELRAEARRESKGFGLNIDWIAELLRYFTSELLTKAVLPISQTTRKQIEEVLSKAQVEGWGVDRTIRELNSDELTMWRARMIVRTESAKARFFGEKAGANKSEFESVKIWISAKDHRTRHSHRQVDGKIVDSDSWFSVPLYKDIGAIDLQVGVDLMEGPGDPKAHAANVINCRCTSVRRLKRVDGRLVSKIGNGSA